MAKKIYPADDLINVTLKNDWTVKEKIELNSSTSGKYSSCYVVEKNTGELGFLKAFDLRDVIKASEIGSHHIDPAILLERSLRKFNSEKSLIIKCDQDNIPNVVRLIDEGIFDKIRGDLNSRVFYFILEYSKDGNLKNNLSGDILNDLTFKFKSLIEIFDAMHEMHQKNIMHLDIKTSNILYFIEERLTKITDFGSARQWLGPVAEEFKDDEDRIMSTRSYAPPEILYCEPYSGDWNQYRKSIDLYLLGNVVVMCFTNFTFTGLLNDQLVSFDKWNNIENQGRMSQLLPSLTSAATIVYTTIEERIHEINNSCGNPLNDSDINLILETITQLCNPNPVKRGHPEALSQTNTNGGLDRFRDRFTTLHKRLEIRSNKTYKTY